LILLLQSIDFIFKNQRLHFKNQRFHFLSTFKWFLANKYRSTVLYISGIVESTPSCTFSCTNPVLELILHTWLESD